MRKGRRQTLLGGDEVDAVSKRARKLLHFKPGEIAAIKRRMNKRARREAIDEARIDLPYRRGAPD